VRTSADYIASLKKMKPEMWWNGERITDITEAPVLKPAMFSWGQTVLDSAFNPDISKYLVAPPDPALLNEEVHGFWAIPRTQKDLIDGLWAARKIGEICPIGAYATIGRDQLVGLMIATYKMDKEAGTNYYGRLIDYVKDFQKHQWTAAACVTDPKGNRRLRPADQADPDLYLRVVERRKDGIIVNGCKMHTTAGSVCEHMLVIPQRFMREEDKDYAVSFVVPLDHPGVKIICRAAGVHRDPVETPLSIRDDIIDTMTIFDHVFVPWEQVFLCGEHKYAVDAAVYFSNINRHPWVGMHVGMFSMMIGAAALMADYNGLKNDKLINEKLIDLIMITNKIWGIGLGAAVQHTIQEPGICMPDSVLTNLGKHLGLEGHFQASFLVQNIAGGITVTIPNMRDITNPETAGYIEKYLAAREGVPTIDKIKVVKFIHDILLSEYATREYTGIMHGSGSPAAERILMLREYDLQHDINLVKKI